LTRTSFDNALGFVLTHEGGYVDHPSDPGGATNFGISLRHAANLGDLDGDGFAEFDLDLDGAVDEDDIEAMTLRDAAAEYRRIWARYGFAAIEDAPIAAKLFDLCVVMGFRGASLVAQRALRACRQAVKEDGYMGPVTIGAVNMKAAAGADELMAAICSEAAGYFRSLGKPGFEPGWLNRAYDRPQIPEE